MADEIQRPRTLELSNDYRPALLWLMNELGSASTEHVLIEFHRRLGDLIPPEHFEKTTWGAMKWRHYVHWSRQDLVKVGLMGGQRGTWEITARGRQWVHDHPNGNWTITPAVHKWLAEHPGGALEEAVRHSPAASGARGKPRTRPPLASLSDEISSSSRTTPGEATEVSRSQVTPSDPTVPVRLNGHTYSLSKSAVVAQLRAAVADGLPREATNFKDWFIRLDGHNLSVKWVVSLATGQPLSSFQTIRARRLLTDLGLAPEQRGQMPSDDGQGYAPDDGLELDRGSFYQAVLQNLDGHLPASVQSRSVNTQVNYLQLACPAPGSHYELRLAKKYTEIALHFEGRRSSNLALLDYFVNHRAELEACVGEPVYTEPWGLNWARIYVQRPRMGLCSASARELAAQWLAFIEATLPTLEKAVADLALPTGRGGPRTIDRDAKLDRPKIILVEEIARIRAYLAGANAGAPSAEKLCDWVQFCYTFELYSEGASLFRLIVPEAVNPWLYQRTRQLARACELRLNR